MNALRLGCARVVLALAAVSPAAVWAVDGVVLIDQNRAISGSVTPGDTPGFPVSINSPGIYKLASNLVVPNENTTAILVNVDNVTIDLNGFAILGPNVCATDGFNPATPCTKPATSAVLGVGVDGVSAGTVRNTRVLNGTIDGMGGIGLYLGVNSRVEKMNVTSNAAYGIYTSGGVILDTLVRANGLTGIFVSGAIISGSRSIFNRGSGISTSNASLLSGNVISTNVSFGLVLSTTVPSRYTDNVINNNNGGDANPQIAGGTQAGANSCGPSGPCP